MEHHVEIGVWGFMWCAYVFCYTILCFQLYLMELWANENLNDINNDNNDDIYLIQFYYSDDSDNENN